MSESDHIPAWARASPLRPPRTPRDVVPRTRLFRAIDQAVAGPLTLVVGPAGSGKTVLVSSWAEQTALPLAWLALDPDSATPERFWEALTLARDGALADGATSPVVVVVDDFHDLGGAIAAELDVLLRHPPDDLRLVLISRRDPPLRLGRLRVAGALAEIRGAQLACTRDETAAVLHALGVRASPDLVGRLQERSEGWMAAIVLAALSLRRRERSLEDLDEFDAHDSALSEYLMSEVLSGLPEDLRSFLLRTSIADPIDGPLAELLSGQDQGHARLVQLAHEGLLLNAVEGRPDAFRYHGLFAELLRAELRWSAPEEVVVALHAAAAAALAERGETLRAVHHAVEAGDWRLAARLVTEGWVDLLLSGELDALAPLLAGLPPEAADDEPEFLLAMAAVALQVQDAERAADAVRFARAAAHDAPTPLMARRIALLELLDAHHRGDIHRARTMAGEALDERPGVARASPGLTSFVLALLGAAETWTGNPVDGRAHLRRALMAAGEARSPWTTFVALCHLAGAESSCGDLAAAQRRSDEARRLARRHGWTATSHAVAADIVAALVAVTQCRFDEAADLLDATEQAAARSPHRVLRAGLALPRIMLLNARGRDGEALDVLHIAVAELGDWPVDSALRQALTAWEAKLLAATGDRSRAVQLLDGLTPTAGLPVLATLARLRVADGECEAAHALLEPALDQAVPIFAAASVEVLAVDAIALDGMLEHERAAEVLERALDTAEPGSALRPLVGLGPALLPLLHRQVRRGTSHRSLIARVVTLIEDRSPATNGAADLREPLSPREAQVLRYLPTDLNNTEIAAELFVSVNTVKTHLRAIYRKLDAANRRDAVARAQHQRLIGPR